MTAVTGIRFLATDLNAGTTAILNMLKAASTDKFIFGTIGNEMIVYQVSV